MRVRNVWFDLWSFILAVSIAGGAVASVVEYNPDRHGSFGRVAIDAGIAVLVAVLFFGMSLRLGNYQKKIHEMGTQERETPGK